jgi:hypothetical protein
MRRMIVSTVVALAAAVMPLPAAADTTVPFRGADSGTFVVLPPDAENVVFAQTSATGHATHLGRYSLIAHEYTDLDDLRIFGGVFTLTAANGDTLFGTYEGRADLAGLPVIAYDVQGPILGGTGRFAGATGWLRWRGAGDLATGMLSEEIEGRVSSVGSLRRGR